MVLPQAEPNEDLLRTNFYGTVDTGGRRPKPLDFFRQPAKYGSFMCLLNCGHRHKANSELVQMPLIDFNGEPTVEGWMKIRIAVLGGTELLWDYGATTNVESEAIPCCCGAELECWVVEHVPKKK